jgi:hypothetical protein
VGLINFVNRNNAREARCCEGKSGSKQGESGNFLTDNLIRK